MDVCLFRLGAMFSHCVIQFFATLAEVHSVRKWVLPFLVACHLYRDWRDASSGISINSFVSQCAPS